MMKFADNNICSKTVNCIGEAEEIHDGEDRGKETLEDMNSLLDHLTLIHFDLDVNESGLYAQEHEACCSRNVMRKQRHWEKIVAAKKSKRRLEKERRKAKQSGDVSGGTDPQQHSKKFLKALTKERLLEAKDSGPKLCIDLSMTDHMSKKEISRLAAQIRRLYGSNKKAAKPFWLYLTDMDWICDPLRSREQDCTEPRLNGTEVSTRTDPATRFLVYGAAGCSQALFSGSVESTEDNFLDLFPLETIVYLTPDSDIVLKDIDPTKVYVLGGLVDESVQKCLISYALTVKQGAGHKH
ncbi:tRNA methyltransferase 10 homolog B isoform X3 [Dendrobates tinctorius]|uniref:tRNA methyltransferase 10 homolog B isoform X3 n=1 Tax=Dendrobates tinctorius TaxID=92724 RepID=UPI003CC9DF1A